MFARYDHLLLSGSPVKDKWVKMHSAREFSLRYLAAFQYRMQSVVIVKKVEIYQFRKIMIDMM